MEALGKMAGGVDKLFEKGGVRRPSMQQRFVSSLKPPFGKTFRPMCFHLEEEPVKMAMGWIDTFFAKFEEMSPFYMIEYLNKNYRRIGERLNCEVIVSPLSKREWNTYFWTKVVNVIHLYMITWIKGLFKKQAVKEPFCSYLSEIRSKYEDMIEVVDRFLPEDLKVQVVWRNYLSCVKKALHTYLDDINAAFSTKGHPYWPRPVYDEYVCSLDVFGAKTLQEEEADFVTL